MDSIKANQRIHIGKIFKSFKDFRSEFTKYCSETHQIFVITKSYLLQSDDEESDDSDDEEDDNELIDDVEDDDSKNYKSCTYNCIRHSKRHKQALSRGNGI